MTSPLNDAQEVTARFQRAAADPLIREARLAVLPAGERALTVIAERIHVLGYVARDDHALASALLAYLGGELLGGMSALFNSDHVYSAAALLRQLIEVEYLAFLAYSQPERAAKWYRAPPADIRREFSPKLMRKASQGLFADHEYWTHCEVGGHPHPKAQMLLHGYGMSQVTQAHLLPDACQHTRRLWTSLKLAQERHGRAEVLEHGDVVAFKGAIARWEELEDDVILSFDGVQRPAS